MKFVLSFICLFLLATSHAQSPLTFTLTLKTYGDSVKVDTIRQLTLKNLPGGKETVFKNLIPINNTFTLPGINGGEYYVSASSPRFYITATTIALCSRCDNTISLQAILKAHDDGKTYTVIDMPARYPGGDKALALDFFSGLTPQEKAQLTAYPQKFFINGIITRDSAICDVYVEPANLDDQTKKIILKGTNHLKKWNCAALNGREKAGSIMIFSTTLMKYQ